ncbi:2C-methyl-D-erythritol 2,4-cyclodiphosphate synthase [Cellvibrio japonicus Ueda107]|uniref:2-C-methyl-D-erythritol 2,4-cyclodiphosphate synthase n=2 Tax=Cellvibrio japonicus TaxID=155077 RepID=ISPF_CELJU|nr:RecName: Full=2-C-methyl-D-erythritol 2,4-cyclodiphosphate synthase; Short=MECDP-synthase; Short=MECPP-synthase; Short=MECPS [Cellvibrio japonicus Ueda107]ACE85773.1 2C-methyl-D-erythritol 2,4-cyclodiphosphate synthase [Cellvibrio japonicus Ueda107]
MSMRIGQGYDVHAFGEGEKIVIGGVVIPHHHGLVAHSDGDVLLHALCDALLGAVALGDIGKHFPDTDMQYRNADSRSLLRMVYAKVSQHGWKLANADMTIVAQAPRMASYIPHMVEVIASDLQSSASQINVKATTSERLGFTGREEGIACYAVVLLESR